MKRPIAEMEAELLEIEKEVKFYITHPKKRPVRGDSDEWKHYEYIWQRYNNLRLNINQRKNSHFQLDI